MYLPDDNEFDKTLSVILTPFCPKMPNLILANISGYMLHVHVMHSGFPTMSKLFSMRVWVAWISSPHIFIVSTCKNTKIHNFDYNRQFPAYFKTAPLVETLSKHALHKHNTSLHNSFVQTLASMDEACYAHQYVLLTMRASHCTVLTKSHVQACYITQFPREYFLSIPSLNNRKLQLLSSPSSSVQSDHGP